LYPPVYGTYTERSMHAFLRCLALVLLLPQCGGGATTGAEPKSAADDAHNSSDASEAAGSSSGDSADASASDAPATAEKSKGPNCDDGTCSKCGSGICPAGWYCDEKASGGGACSWLT
jgi:hypothetical protein